MSVDLEKSVVRETTKLTKLITKVIIEGVNMIFASLASSAFVIVVGIVLLCFDIEGIEL